MPKRPGVFLRGAGGYEDLAFDHRPSPVGLSFTPRPRDSCVRQPPVPTWKVNQEDCIRFASALVPRLQTHRWAIEFALFSYPPRTGLFSFRFA